MKPTSRHDFKQSFLPAIVLSFICFTVLFYSLSGCRVQAGNPQADKPKNPGTVTVALADAPVDDFANLFITVKAIAFAPEGTGKCLSDPRRGCADSSLVSFDLNNDIEVDLLSLSDGRTQVLPFARELPAGVYEGLRLFLSEGTPVRGILKPNGNEVEVRFPVGPFGRREFTLAEEFDVQEGIDNEIIVHVDLRRSIQKSAAGEYSLIPFSHVVPTRFAARLSGSVSAPDATRVCAYNVGGKRRPEGHGVPGKSGPGQNHPPLDLPMRMGNQPDMRISFGPMPPQRFPGQPDLTSSCDNAEAVADIKEGRYDIRYLPPVNFILRVFKSDGTFTDTTLDSALKPQESRMLDL